jgi:acyl transferase domain-containing protein
MLIRKQIYKSFNNQLINKCLFTSDNKEISHKIGFMFPGQGSQYIGMGVDLYNELPIAKELFDTASDILGYNLIDKCKHGPKEELDSTEIAQIAIFVSSMAALEKLKVVEPSAIDRCTVTMGLSLGIYLSMHLSISSIYLSINRRIFSSLFCKYLYFRRRG